MTGRDAAARLRALLAHVRSRASALAAAPIVARSIRCARGWVAARARSMARGFSTTTLAALAVSLCMALTLFLPLALFKPGRDKPLSSAIYDRDGKLLAASVADDGQWRLPE
ncbi:MAG TPA: hypothetical protein PKO22_01195, partial [Treponemataceae bacterium]|nr:hypothetical protein [Treponemataceae bacterium]